MFSLPLLTCKLNMKFIFWFENLDVERTVWSKVLCCPSPQNSLVILCEETVLFYLSNDSFVMQYGFYGPWSLSVEYWAPYSTENHNIPISTNLSATTKRKWSVKGNCTIKIIVIVSCFILETGSASALSNTRICDSQQQFGRLHFCCSGWSRPQRRPS